MSGARFTGDPVHDEVVRVTLQLDSERDRLRGVIRASLRVGRLRRADLAKLGTVLVELSALREIERHVLPDLVREGEDAGDRGASP